MIEPLHMTGPFDWDDSDVEVQFDGKHYAVVDEKNDFKLLCEHVILAEKDKTTK